MRCHRERSSTVAHRFRQRRPRLGTITPTASATSRLSAQTASAADGAALPVEAG